jgi:hypothetical protein
MFVIYDSEKIFPHILSTKELLMKNNYLKHHTPYNRLIQKPFLLPKTLKINYRWDSNM